jgi:hypothetical protein
MPPAFALIESSRQTYAVRFDVHFNCAKSSDEQAFNFVAEGWLDNEHGKMYFVVRPCALGFQCWSLGDDSSPLAPDEAFEVGAAAPTVWLALPESLRHSLHGVNNLSAI